MRWVNNRIFFMNYPFKHCRLHYMINRSEKGKWYKKNTETQDKEYINERKEYDWKRKKKGRGKYRSRDKPSAGVWPEDSVERGSQLVLSLTYTHWLSAGPNQTREKQQKHDHFPSVLHTNTSTGSVCGCFYDRWYTNKKKLACHIQVLDEIWGADTCHFMSFCSMYWL